MPHYAESKILPYTPEQLFDLVADVKQYPEFLPWIIAVRVRSSNEKSMLADLIVGFKALRESFTSHIILDSPHHLKVDYIEGPLSHLHNEWHFIPDPSGGTRLDFMVDFSFKSRIFEAIAGQFFDRAVQRMATAFEDRANNLYGQKTDPAVS
ncbi:MAG: type II toxin-antitoxin system RatA family toxin [Zymomonas mobilis subsp. pomaceae]|uniref:Cyclase/dehydrase n=1 Tax=Zymomonas mobilis subsp. pomaceae (strain ATCC 29192 / DSM 22645 / JCM 10191 / CCUG 17912 / NBRC 13757 / NCIMB 11200 / NRRL B-4491 / Barker I) TaxID=579138 RepID=F8ETQ9_ZYMMT|nr:type II toxin-antitoxin system RatA family toxin [Zymomonas mobilis]AEI37069.1 cyclase/dehydrase [Zymomonas mobilis subsp. pomaceae ATCC 29192]MDX5948440.1 type II toxin-antitoxin system RatA family toxin [Zymomonas mobilis subsp. pomaceae]GEB89496.1 ubiquinone-binding protein [Zymomonas mobilis subsp. pomaceae]